MRVSLLIAALLLLATAVVSARGLPRTANATRAA
jgi:hypothetical protein